MTQCDGFAIREALELGGNLFNPDVAVEDHIAALDTIIRDSSVSVDDKALLTSLVTDTTYTMIDSNGELFDADYNGLGIDFNAWEAGSNYYVLLNEEEYNSIKENGIIQPLLLTKEGGQYFLIAGERRLRASQLAGLKEVPCIVRDIAQVDSAALAIIENIQREGLSQLEEGEAYKKLIDSYQLTQEDLSKKLGKSRTYITNSIRLLQLPAEVKALIEAGELSGSHGRGILAVEKKYQLELANYVVKHRLNVRELENLTKDFNIEKLRGAKDKKPKDKDIHILDVERTLENSFGTKVTIKGKNKGSISLEYYSKEDLIRITDILLKFRS